MKQKSDRERQILYDLTYKQRKKKRKNRTLNRLVVARGRRLRAGEKGESGQKIHTSSYKINKFWGCNGQHSAYSLQHCIVYLKVIKRINFKSSHRERKNNW